MELPEFRTHGFDQKFNPLAECDLESSPHSKQLIKFVRAWIARPLVGIRILDLGCGRGELVAALRSEGARAFGIEVDPRFVASGGLLDIIYPDEQPILSLVDGGGRSIFPDGYFDLVISDQVLEHVADLDGVASEVARVLRPGGWTIHQFPARFRGIEPHYLMPLVHWLPKTRVRKMAMRLLLAAGMAKQFFPGHSNADRAAIIYKYSVEETFYRPIREIEAAFERRGISSTYLDGMNSFVRSRIGRSLPAHQIFSRAIGAFRMSVFTGRKSGAQ